MRTSSIKVTSRGEGMEEALEETEKLGREAELTDKELFHLRLLAEELFGTMRSIAGDVAADYLVEQEGKAFRINLVSKVELTLEMKQRFISAASNGENEAGKGFMGMIRDIIGTVLLPSEAGPNMLSLGLASLGSPTGYGADNTYTWSMVNYVNGVKASREPEAQDAWERLERSIVASIADDVKVYIRGTEVKIIISKEF